jgi:hypothetical protein
LGAFFGLLDSVPRRGLDFYLFKFIGESTPKPADRFGGSTPKFGGFGGLGVDSPIFGSRLAKPLWVFSNHFSKYLKKSRSTQMQAKGMIMNEKLKKNDQQLLLNRWGMCHPPDQPCNQSGTEIKSNSNLSPVPSTL